MKRVFGLGLAVVVAATMGLLAPQTAATASAVPAGYIVTPDGKTVKQLPSLKGTAPNKTSHIYKGKPEAKTGGVTTLAAGVCDGVTGNACFNYNIGSQSSLSKNGITGVNRVGGNTGALQADGYHTLGETAVQSSDQKQIIEVGWTVDPTVNKDASGNGVTTPRPFVFYWINGTPGVYNGGAFVPVSGATVVPGVTDLNPGDIPKFVVWHDDTQHVWWISWNGVYMGFYRDTTWTGASPSVSFTRMQLVQNFGEIASTVSKPCTDMGLGVSNATTGARFSSIAYIGPVYNDPLDVTSVNMSLSSTANASSPEAGAIGAGSPPSTTNLRSFYYGGPMWNAAKTGVGSTGAC